MCPAEAGAQSEVGEADVSVAVDEDVVGLDVAVNEAHRVHRLDRQDELGDIELCQRVTEDLLLDEQAHQVPARNVVHHKVQVRRILHTQCSQR